MRLDSAGGMVQTGYIVLLSMALLVLSVVGFLISSYFTAVSLRWIEPEAAWIPRFCRLGRQTCATLVFTPRARLLGVPNSVLGQVFYLAIMAGLLEEGLLAPPFIFLYLGASFLTVLMGLFLTCSLIFVTRVPCKLCFTSHALNLVIFLLLTGCLLAGN